MEGYKWKQPLSFIAIFYGIAVGGMAQSDVMLHIATDLAEGDIAYHGQIIVFRCTIRGSRTILAWKSDDYIGTGGFTLQFASIHNPGRTNSSQTVPTTNATLISTSTDNGVTVIESELHIRADMQHPTSFVTCQVNGNGHSNTSTFSVLPSVVMLTSDLAKGDTAYDGQNATFWCTMRGSRTILAWSSDDYIGTGGYTLQFVSLHSPGRTNSSLTVPTTNATLISTSTDNGVTVIESELHIRADVQHPISSVTCQVNGNGHSTTVTFQTLPKPTTIATTSMMIETRSVPDGGDSISNRVTDINSSQDTAQGLSDVHLAIIIAITSCVAILVVVILAVVVGLLIRRHFKITPKGDYNKNSPDETSSETSEGSVGSDSKILPPSEKAAMP